jgi:hypothetical protein
MANVADNRANVNSPPRPEALRVRPKRIPDALKAIPQWVVWRYDWDPDAKRKDGSGKKGEWTKPPYNARTGQKASSTDRRTWCSFQAAMAAYREGGWDGFGIVLTESLGIVGIDLDHCRDPGTGSVEPWAQAIIDAVPSYAEVSPSATGIRILAYGAKPAGRCRKGNVEMYATGRYLTVTGHHLEGCPNRLARRPKSIVKLHAELFGRAADQPRATFPDPSANGHPPDLGDAEIIAQAKAAKDGDKFSRLWAGDTSGYPSPSEADLGLCDLLAFWAGPNPDRIDRLFRQSGLMRDKWDRADYRERTIAKALEGRTEFYYPEKAAPEDGKGKKPQSAVLVDLALAAGIELFHDGDKEGYASLPVAGHVETLRLKSKGFRKWLGRFYHDRVGKAPGAQAMQDALLVLEGKACYDGPEHLVWVRVAEQGGKIYLDLCNDQWQAVEIDRDGWRVVDTPPVKFRRAKAIKPLPAPVAGGDVNELKSFLTAKKTDWPLVLGWLVAALRPQGPYPVLCFSGEQGSGKSTQARALRALIDPNSAPVRAEPREPRDLAIAANNAWVISLDNLSYLQPWLSDALCRLATGGGFATRTLYADDEETIFDSQRPITLNGIEEVATRPDLLDRSLLVPLPAITEQRRKTEADYWVEFNEACPRILGALLDAVATGLRRLPDVHPVLPRMADFARWAVACEPALGLEDGAFLAAYSANARDAVEIALDASVIATPLRQFLNQQDGEWEGTAGELLEGISRFAPERNARPKGWPNQANVLGGMLRRLAPNLRKAGICVRFERTNQHGRVIKMSSEQVGKPST